MKKEKYKFIIDKEGNKFWYLPSKGKNCIHRIGGPAIERVDGVIEWWLNDELHRIDGPAVIDLYSDYIEWWINDKELPKEEVEKWLKENKIDLSTKEGQIAFKLRWKGI